MFASSTSVGGALHKKASTARQGSFLPFDVVSLKLRCVVCGSFLPAPYMIFLTEPGAYSAYANLQADLFAS